MSEGWPSYKCLLLALEKQTVVHLQQDIPCWFKAAPPLCFRLLPVKNCSTFDWLNIKWSMHKMTYTLDFKGTKSGPHSLATLGQ